jgi:hypothetical protein
MCVCVCVSDCGFDNVTYYDNARADTHLVLSVLLYQTACWTQTTQRHLSSKLRVVRPGRRKADHITKQAVRLCKVQLRLSGMSYLKFLMLFGVSLSIAVDMSILKMPTAMFVEMLENIQHSTRFIHQKPKLWTELQSRKRNGKIILWMGLSKTADYQIVERVGKCFSFRMGFKIRKNREQHNMWSRKCEKRLHDGENIYRVRTTVM